MQRSTRGRESKRENGRQAEEDFGPSELTVETLYGETEHRWGAIEEDGTETTKDESVTSDGYWKRIHYNTDI